MSKNGRLSNNLHFEMGIKNNKWCIYILLTMIVSFKKTVCTPI